MSAPATLEQRLSLIPRKYARPFEELLKRGQIDEPTTAIILEAGERSGDVSKLIGFAVGYLFMTARNIPVADVIQMSGQLGRTVNLGWSPRRWSDEHTRLSRAITLQTLAAKSETYDVAGFARFLPGRFPGYLIRSSRRLGMEGLRQRHCVASYHSPHMGKGFAIAAVFVDRRRWTVQLTWSSGAKDAIVIAQARGRSNALPDAATLKRIHEVLDVEYRPSVARHQSETPRFYVSYLQAALPILRAAEVKSVQVCFDGGGDEGSIWSIDYLEGECNIGEQVVVVDEVSSVFRAGEWIRSVEPSEMTMDKVVENLAYDYLEFSAVDYCNNDGGYGDFVIDVRNGTAELLVNQRYTESTCEFSQTIDITTGQEI